MQTINAVCVQGVRNSPLWPGLIGGAATASRGPHSRRHSPHRLAGCAPAPLDT
jgi:hypothetical protein